MTPEDHRLDVSSLTSRTSIPLYRLAKTRYANLSGVGASVAPGRWNRRGQEAIYTSTELSVPVLERLVHTPKQTIPNNLSMMRLMWECEWLAPAEWDQCVRFGQRSGLNNVLVFDTLKAARTRFEKDSFSEVVPPLAIALPSVIVPVWNIVLYPYGWGFWEHVKLAGVEPFSFDPRLFQENAAVEEQPVL